MSKLAAAIDDDEPHALPKADVERFVPAVTTDVEYRQPWEQTEGENGFQYLLFSHYRDQGVGRTIAEVSRHFNSHPEDLGGKDVKRVNPNYTHQLSKKFNWKSRVLAFDNEQERIYQLARSEAIRAMVDRHETRIVDAIDSLMAPINALNHAISSDPDFVKNLSKTDARKLISMSNQAAKTIPSLMNAERLARGMPTEIVGGTIDHNHTVEIERDRIGEILGILADAGVLNDGLAGLGAGEVVDAEVVDVHPVSADGDGE